jgi:hypothetical protein
MIDLILHFLYELQLYLKAMCSNYFRVGEVDKN